MQRLCGDSGRNGDSIIPKPNKKYGMDGFSFLHLRNEKCEDKQSEALLLEGNSSTLGLDFGPRGLKPIRHSFCYHYDKATPSDATFLSVSLFILLLMTVMLNLLLVHACVTSSMMFMMFFLNLNFYTFWAADPKGTMSYRTEG